MGRVYNAAVLMALAPGARIGPYETTGLLGSGGMGEVYRARDRRLNRDVAIKVLPDAFLADPDRVARFEREARALAALNHPNIAGIYGLEESSGVKALVLELVEGPTLADRIAAGPLPVPEALDLARQIAEALEAAHEKGVVHRDLKPANIKMTPAGVVKVLDFGLAAMSREVGPPAADTTHSPTQAALVTRHGVILGTAAYMSPEQARGKTVDKRADIWAFGCVLYEMLTSAQAFGGATMTDTLVAVIEREPNWAALPLAVPQAIKRLLTRCLDKSLRSRLHDIGDARVEIENVLNGASTASVATAVVDPHRRAGRLPWSIAVFASIVAIAALTWTARNTPRAPGPAPLVSRLTVAAPGTSAAALNDGRSVAITPDGTRIVYVANSGRQILVRALDQLDATAIVTAIAPLNGVFVSPDGEWVGFVDGSALRRVAITGGPPVTIAQPVSAATWAPDDTIIVANPDADTGLQRLSAAGGALTVLTQPAPERGELDHAWPEMLPGGRAVLFTITAITGGLDAAQVAVLDLATGKSKVVVRGGSDARYVSSGHLVYAAGGALRAIPFDLGRLETHGTPVTVLPRLTTSPQGAGHFSVAVNGTLAYLDTPEAEATERTLVWVDRQGREEPLGMPPRRYYHPRLSPDGTRVAVAIADQENDIWVWDLARHTLSRRTFDPAVDFFPVWTPDGRRLIFALQRGSGSMLFSQRADGTGAAEPIATGLSSGGMGLPSGVTPDGTRVLFHTNFGNRELMVLALDGTGSAEALFATPFNERNAVVSPDGRWLAYESDNSGRFEIYVRPFPTTDAGQWSISTAGGVRPVWASSGRELFYEAPGGALMAVRVDPRGVAWNADSPVKVLEGPYFNQGGGNRNYDVSADARHFLMIKQPVTQTGPQIIIVQNWFDELKRLVPSR